MPRTRKGGTIAVPAAPASGPKLLVLNVVGVMTPPPKGTPAVRNGIAKVEVLWKKGETP